MNLVVILIVAGMTLFAVWSGYREASLYRRYLQGQTQYLVSKRRRNRRLLISIVLLAEAVCLFLGFFQLDFSTPGTALVFWLFPLVLIVLLVYLGILDFHETSKEIDHIFREASESILKSNRVNQGDTKARS